MMTKVSPVPDGFYTVTPILVVEDASRAIEFYRTAFGAEELVRHTDPKGNVRHAELKVGDSMVMLEEGFEFAGVVAHSPQALKGTSMFLYLYVDDVDGAFSRATAAGAKEFTPVSETYYGDRRGGVVDPSGHLWWLATRKENLSPEEIQRRAVAAGRA